jgi:signal transduction histidine kinase
MEKETDRLIRLVKHLLVAYPGGCRRAEIGSQSCGSDRSGKGCDATGSARWLFHHGVDAGCETGKVNLMILGDVDRLSQVIDNLLDNACVSARGKCRAGGD